MNTARDVIHDTHATHATSPHVGNLLHVSPAEAVALRDALVQLGADTRMGRARHAHYLGREYTVVPAETRCSVSSKDSVHAKIVLVRDGDPATRWIVLTYSLYATPRGTVCSFVGNPTTLIAGSNVRPVRVDNTDTMDETLTFFRVGFEFLSALCVGFAWDSDTGSAIAAGNILVSNAQWALYLPSADKTRDLALLASMYCGRLAHETMPHSLGEHLGFATADTRTVNGHTLSGLFLTRKWGTNHVLSVNFYDKRAAVTAKHQTPTLSDAERVLVDNSLRLDITAHTGWLTTMIRAAQRHVDVLCSAKPALRDRLAVFLADTAPTAARVARAMQLLGYTVRDGALVRTGFAAWLLHAVLEDELHLVGLLRGTVDSLDVVHPDAACAAALGAWRDGTAWDAMAGALDWSRAKLYRVRDRVRTDTAIDLSIPYAYWRDWAFVSLTYGLRSETVDAVRRALYDTTLDPASRVAVLDSAAAIRTMALEASRTRMLHSIGVVARAVEATPLVALLAGDDSLWTDPRVVWDRAHVDGVHVG